MNEWAYSPFQSSFVERLYVQSQHEASGFLAVFHDNTLSPPSFHSYNTRATGYGSSRVGCSGCWISSRQEKESFLFSVLNTSQLSGIAFIRSPATSMCGCPTLDQRTFLTELILMQQNDNPAPGQNLFFQADKHRETASFVGEVLSI